MKRLLSLDTYRGFLMVILASSGLQIPKVAARFPDSAAWRFLGYEFGHPPWRSCSFWDLVQPSFMFMVGVAVPYSVASRRARGDSPNGILAHALWRSLVLVLLGVFLSSSGKAHTEWSFVNVLSQIGLGYTFLVLLEGRGLRVQLAALGAILFGYWLCFVLYPVAGAPGIAAHFDKGTNFAARVDLSLLNLFPPHDYRFNDGGYQTLNFVPSTATMLIGVMAGELLRGSRTSEEKLRWLLRAGAICFAAGVVADPRILPFVHGGWVLCPIVKRIWTPSWAVFCASWTLWILAGFYWLIDLRGRQRWTTPFVAVGMNCTAMYLMWQLWKGWVLRSIESHLGRAPFEGTYGPIVASLAWTAVLWAVCFWMYRRKIFLKV
jgi:predicted acyltransferase